MPNCNFCSDVGFRQINSTEGSLNSSKSRKRSADSESAENVEDMDTSEENEFITRKVC